MQRPRSTLKPGAGGWARQFPAWAPGRCPASFVFPSQPSLMQIFCWFTAKTKTQFSVTRHIPVDHKDILSYLNLVSVETDSLLHLLLDLCVLKP